MFFTSALLTTKQESVAASCACNYQCVELYLRRRWCPSEQGHTRDLPIRCFPVQLPLRRWLVRTSSIDQTFIFADGQLACSNLAEYPFVYIWCSPFLRVRRVAWN
ncbi:unnamed protein product [Dicrocoelium dendriticum]|nr:unnamed protein product [Dicrocoelium dendriticum]